MIDKVENKISGVDKDKNYDYTKYRNLSIFIGGQHIGGRTASLVVCDNLPNIKGVIAIGFTFYP